MPVLVHVPPLPLSGRHWPPLRYRLLAHDVQTPVVQAAHVLYAQQ